jgi:hypothetical protein
VSTETTAVQAEPRAMLALIALAALPMPDAVRFHPNGEILSLSFERIADGQAWSSHLGGSTDTYVYNGQTFLNEGVIRWRGWSVHLLAAEAHTPDAALDEDTAGQLLAVAASGVTSEPTNP